MRPSRWHFELWTPDGELLADLAGRAKNRRIIQSRNEAEQIHWQLDLNEFESYCESIHVDPNSLIVPGVTEVRVRRGQNYLCGGQVVYRNPRVTSAAQDLHIRADGFLNLFDERHTDELRQFTATQATTIYSTLITESQALDNGDYGITIGTLATVGTHDKTFKAVKLKEAIQRGCELFGFDHEFTHDKVFNTYAAIGSRRPEIVFEYPGNVIELGAPLDATNIANEVSVLGSGSGTEGNVKVTVEDVNSQIDYKLRQRRISYSEVEDLDDLENHGNVELAAWSRPYEVPDLIVDGNVAPYVTDYGIGDYVNVVVARYSSLRHLNGLARVERREITIDENDNETVKLYLSR